MNINSIIVRFCKIIVSFVIFWNLLTIRLNVDNNSNFIFD